MSLLAIRPIPQGQLTSIIHVALQGQMTKKTVMMKKCAFISHVLGINAINAAYLRSKGPCQNSSQM